MEPFFPWIVTCFSVVLFGLSCRSIYLQHWKSATTALSFTLIFLVLVSASKYREFSGFGFEAKMWGKEQLEAEQLVEKLQTASTITIKQLALITSQLGQSYSGLSNPEMMQSIEELRTFLSNNGVSEKSQDQLLSPMLERVEENYYVAEWKLASKEINDDIRTIDSVHDADLYARMNNLNNENLSQFHDPLSNWNKWFFSHEGELMPIIDDKSFQQKMADLETDLAYFKRNHRLRRSIDIFVH